MIFAVICVRFDDSSPNLWVLYIFRRAHRRQLSFEDFFLPFCGKLFDDNHRINHAELVPWDEMEDDYAAKFCMGFEAPAKTFLMALGALIMIIKLLPGFTDEALFVLIKDNPSLQFLIGLEVFQHLAPFHASISVFFRRHLQEFVVNNSNEMIVRQGLNVTRSSDSQGPVDPSERQLRRISFTPHSC